ncbi:hypothetical protein ACU61A_03930 [Pseudonocardia sichuanensis]
MSRPAPSDVPAAGSLRQGTRVTRFARAAAVVLSAGAALTGCTVAVDGWATARPAPVARPVPVPDTPGPVGSDGETALYAEWVAGGWEPQPVLPVSDPDSGVSAWMFGTPAPRPDTPDGATAFQAIGAPASVVTWFGVFPVPEGYVADARQGALNTAATKNGRVTRIDAVTVAGHPGVDVRIEFRTAEGYDMIDLIRYVELPGHLAGIESIGVRGDERVLQQVQQVMVDKLSVPVGGTG